MKKLICLLWLFSVPVFAQNCARMVNGVNAQTGTSYTLASLDALRLTTFSNANPVGVNLPSGLSAGFGACTVFSLQNLGSGTVTVTCTGCKISANGAPASTFSLSAGAGADIYSAGLNYSAQTGSGSGGGGGAVSSVFTRAGVVGAVNTDYGGVGIQQVGTGTLNIAKTAGGTLALGSASSYLKFLPDASASAVITMQDPLGNYFLTGAGNSGNALIQMGTNVNAATGANIWLDSESGFPLIHMLFGVSAADDDYDFSDTSALFSRPLNLTAGLQLNGSFGLNGQVLCSNGSGIVFSSSCGGASGVTSIGFTANQTKNTGSAGSPVVALAFPLIFTGNITGTQNANSDDFLTCIRNTDTLPTGTCFKIKSAGGSILAYFDVSGNLFANSLVGTGGGAGYSAQGQGTDNCVSALALVTSQFGVNGSCEEAPSSITAPFYIVKAGTAPAAASVRTYTTASGSPLSTTQSYTPVTGNSAHIQTADATVAGAASGVIATLDGSGNTHSSGINISTVLPSLQGPGSAYTNSAANTGSTAYTYGTSIPASSTVLITCIGSYKFTTAVNTAEFALNFTSAPTNLFLNVEIGANATTGTHTYGRQTTNGALVTAGIAAAAFGTYYPVTISGGVTTNGATTFTIQAAQVTAVGSSVLNVDQNGFTCSVK